MPFAECKNEKTIQTLRKILYSSIMGRLQNTIKEITTHSYIYDITIRCLSKFRSRVLLEVLTGFSRLVLSGSCTNRRIPRSPNDYSRDGGDMQRRDWDAKTSIDPWSAGVSHTERVPRWFALHSIVVPIPVLHNLKDLELLMQPLNVLIRLLLNFLLISKCLL